VVVARVPFHVELSLLELCKYRPFGEEASDRLWRREVIMRNDNNTEMNTIFYLDEKYQMENIH